MATIGSLWINVKSNTTGLSKGLGKAKGMLGKFGKFAASPAGIAVAAFAALTAGVMLTVKALGSALKEFMKFEAGMAEVKSVMLGLDPTAMEAMEDTAKRLGATTAFTAEEAAQGMAMLARAGFTAAENIVALPSVLDLASASGLGLAEAADIMATGMSGFGIEAEHAAHFADVLAVGANSANTTVAEMGEAFQHVAPIAKQLGFSVEETSAMIAHLQDSGIKGGKAGTALRVVFSELGGEIEKNGTGALKKYLKEGHNFTENLEKFGKLGVNAVGILQGMTDETESLTTTMEEATGVVNEMAEARLDTLAGDITFFESAVSGLKTEIGEKLAPTFREIVQVATKFIGGLQAAFSSVFGGVEGSIISTETLMAVFKVMGGIIIGIVTIVGKVYNQVAFVINTIKALVYGLVAAIVLSVTNVVKAVAWGLDAIGVISTDTYNEIANTSNALVEDLGNSALEAAKDAGANFIDGFAGGAEIAGAKAFSTFSDSMDGVGKTAGDNLTEGMAESIEEGAPKVTAALETLTVEQEELIASGTKLTDNLQDQITYFGMSAAEILIAKAAEADLTSATVEGTLALEQQLQALKDKATAEEEALQKSEALEDAAKKVIESLRTDQQVFDDEKAKFQEMMDAKLLTLEQFDKAVAKLKKGTEKDIEVNIVTKGIIEGLSTALGTVKVAGQVDKTEQLAEKQLKTSEKIEQVMNSVRDNTAQSLSRLDTVAEKSADVVTKLNHVRVSDVSGLQSKLSTIVSAINNISDDNSMDETENLLGKSNDLNRWQLSQLEKLNVAIGNISGGGGLT